MFYALHPDLDKLISYKEYVQLATEKGFQHANDYKGARCPVCKRRMKVRAGHKKDDGHFYHNDSEFCPTKDPASRPYISKSPTTVDLAVVRKNKKFAAKNIKLIWNKINNLVPYVDLGEFIEILNEARRLNVYGYANLNPELLPYVYVTLINFLPQHSKNKQRKLKFCFFYDSSVDSYDKLWIDRGNDSRLIRISYEGSKTKKVRLYDISDNYLYEDAKYQLSDKQKNWCLEYLA